MGIVKSIAALSLVICATAHAEFKDGNALLNDMNGGHGKQMNALGYVSGVADALMDITFCPPSNVTTGQIYDMVKIYLDAYPATRHMTGDSIVNRVLSTAWPCAKRGQPL